MKVNFGVYATTKLLDIFYQAFPFSGYNPANATINEKKISSPKAAIILLKYLASNPLRLFTSLLGLPNHLSNKDFKELNKLPNIYPHSCRRIITDGQTLTTDFPKKLTFNQLKNNLLGASKWKAPFRIIGYIIKAVFYLCFLLPKILTEILPALLFTYPANLVLYAISGGKLEKDGTFKCPNKLGFLKGLAWYGAKGWSFIGEVALLVGRSITSPWKGLGMAAAQGKALSTAILKTLGLKQTSIGAQIFRGITSGLLAILSGTITAATWTLALSFTLPFLPVIFPNLSVPISVPSSFSSLVSPVVSLGNAIMPALSLIGLSPPPLIAGISALAALIIPAFGGLTDLTVKSIANCCPRKKQSSYVPITINNDNEESGYSPLNSDNKNSYKIENGIGITPQPTNTKSICDFFKFRNTEPQKNHASDNNFNYTSYDSLFEREKPKNKSCCQPLLELFDCCCFFQSSPENQVEEVFVDDATFRFEQW